MRSETNGLRAQTTTSPLSCKAGYAVVEVLAEKKKRTKQSCLLAVQGADYPCRACVIMAGWCRNQMLVAIPLWMCFGKAGELTQILERFVFMSPDLMSRDLALGFSFREK